MGEEPERRGLIVLADGAHAAFAAGAVAELAGSGARWRVTAGAGLGAHVAALAAIGETEEIERRWRRQAELGCPLLRPLIRAWRQRLGAAEGALVLPDALALGGWLDPVELDEFLAPEAAGLPERLRRAGARTAVAVHDLDLGESRWVAIESVGAPEALGVLTAAACFPSGWPPLVARSETQSRSAVGRCRGGAGGGVPLLWRPPGGTWCAASRCPRHADRRPARRCSSSSSAATSTARRSASGDGAGSRAAPCGSWRRPLRHGRGSRIATGPTSASSTRCRGSRTAS